MKVKIRGLVFAGFAAAVFAQSAMAQTADNTVTSKTYVDAKFQAQAKRVTSTNIETIVPETDPEQDVWEHDDLYPSMKVLKDNGVVDAQPKADTLVDEGVLEQNAAWIGWHNGDNNEQVDWVKLKGEGYTEIMHDASKGHLVKIVDSKIANNAATIAGSGGNGPISTDFDDLTTAKAVYDFVTGDANGGGFQPKTHVDSTNGEANNSLKFGMGEGEWGVVRAYGQTSPNQTANSYLQIVSESERDTYSIGIDPNKVASHGASGGSGNNVYSNQILSGSASLATANAVYEYAVPYQWDSSTQASKTLVTDSNGRVTVSTVPTLPEFGATDPCKADGVHCALVTNYNTQSGEISFEWTTMAITQ